MSSEGSVRKVGDRVRINAQLIDGASGGHVWADRFDRDLTDIFTIQDEISKAIVAALEAQAAAGGEKGDRAAPAPPSAEAYNLYLLARQYWVTGNHGDPRREERVMRICSRAVEIDPYYADAWALLALAQSSLRYDFGRDIDDGFAAAQRRPVDRPGHPAGAACRWSSGSCSGATTANAAAEMEKALRLGAEFLGGEQGSWTLFPAAARR